jgi:hypothetical protein
MKSLSERLEDRIKQRDVNAPDTPYEMGRVIGLPAAADPAIQTLAKQQAEKIEKITQEEEQAANETTDATTDANKASTKTSSK